MPLEMGGTVSSAGIPDKAKPPSATVTPLGGWLMRSLVGAGLCLAATSCAVPADTAAGADEVRIPPVEAPRARMPEKFIPAVLRLPRGNGPFPAVIVLHGCSGRGPSQITWARRLNAWGYAAVIPDSMTPRGIKRVCEPHDQPLVTPRDRVGDIGSTVAWLKSQPEIDPGRIAVLGLSHGGSAAALATQRSYENFGLRAAIDYYGPCIDPAAHGDVPLLVLAGEADDWGHPAARCQAYALAVQPEVVEVYSYPGVYHAFDNPDIVRTVSNDHIMEYNRPAAEDSYVRVHDFLGRWVGPKPAARRQPESGTRRSIAAVSAGRSSATASAPAAIAIGP
jgi:dienelactone hydrolase